MSTTNDDTSTARIGNKNKSRLAAIAGETGQDIRYLMDVAAERLIHDVDTFGNQAALRGFKRPGANRRGRVIA